MVRLFRQPPAFSNRLVFQRIKGSGKRGQSENCKQKACHEIQVWEMLQSMARSLRIQYEGAKYHVINRGNYRSDIYATRGAAESFQKTVTEAVVRYGWKLHAYVIMRNHYHLAIETPQPNLTEGMRWLQSTAAARFNRYRKEHGHVFQGRYKALVIEDTAALCRVVDYIHLNPVRAGAVPPGQIETYEMSSLWRLAKKARLPGMCSAEWLEGRGGWKDNARGVAAYIEYLKEMGADEDRQRQQGLEKLSRGWALGTQGWKTALAREYSHKAYSRGMERREVEELRKAHWRKLLESELSKAGKSQSEMRSELLCPEWKLAIATMLQRTGGAPIRWLAEHLHMGKPDAVRSRISRYRNEIS
jgi:REP element-mobilizing transposase RayT